MTNHRIVRWENGQASVADAEGRAMHSRIGPEAEAKTVYLEPSQLEERVKKTCESPLIILDVGMGLATNALAVIQRLQELSPFTRPVRIESFETTVEGLELALTHAEEPAFRWLSPHGEKVRTLLETSDWKDPERPIEWRLHRGDFREHLSQVPAHGAELVYFDFYAPKTCPELWSPELFTAVRNKVSATAGLLLTYSSATPIRAALLLAGWYIGAGPRTLAKLDTTLASPSPEALPSGTLLGVAWRRKLDTSTQVAPEALLTKALTLAARHDLDSQIRETLRRHPQWSLAQE